MDGRRTLGLGAALVALAIAAPATAAERPPRPDDVSAVDVYTENLPTSSGPRPGTGPDGAPPFALPPKVASELRESGAPDATVLEQVAVSPGYGAPSRPLPDVPVSDESTGGAPDVPGAVDVVAEAGSGRAVALLAALGVVTAALVAFAVRRRPRPE